jgi:uncharacterized protein
MNLQEFLTKFPPPGKVLFAKVWGSRSHNTAKEGSDTDFAGVYFYPTSELLSVRHHNEKGPQETWKYDKEDNKDDGNASKEDNPDREFHEAGKFAELLLKGNPTLIEMLYTEKNIITTPAWEELRAIRDKFLCQESVRQYIGYMQGQLRRLVASEGKKGMHTKGGKYSEKWAYHILRLAADAKRIAAGQPPQVWKEGPEQEFLMRVRNEEFTWEEVKVMIEGSIAKTITTEPMPGWDDKKGYEVWLDKGLEALPIPKYGDKNALNAWLLKLRIQNW